MVPQARHVPVSHMRPVPHIEPVQHGCEAPPHAAHVPALQKLPALHELPAQHVWPTPPQAMQRLPLQTKPVSHAVPQHACPRRPQRSQRPPMHALPALHDIPAQQGKSVAPQVGPEGTSIDIIAGLSVLTSATTPLSTTPRSLATSNPGVGASVITSMATPESLLVRTSDAASRGRASGRASSTTAHAVAARAAASDDHERARKFMNIERLEHRCAARVQSRASSGPPLGGWQHATSGCEHATGGWHHATGGCPRATEWLRARHAMRAVASLAGSLRPALFLCERGSSTFVRRAA